MLARVGEGNFRKVGVGVGHFISDSETLVGREFNIASGNSRKNTSLSLIFLEKKDKLVFTFSSSSFAKSVLYTGLM